MSTDPAYFNPTRYSKINWVTAIAMTIFHILGFVALFQFSWRNFWWAVGLYYVSVGLGISMGYHRLHTHRGFKTPKWFEYFLAVCGTLTLEGGPIFWVAVHRQHHQYSDKPQDPHTPRVSGFWAHVGWILFGETQHNATAINSKYAPDLGKDPFYRWLNTWHWVPLTVLGLYLLSIGGWPLVNWAIFLRVCAGLHATWLINSATHLWGGRRFETTDDSRNIWWVSLFSFGEGWHNNHHAHPTSLRHGMVWYEFDPTWYTMQFLKAIGLAWDFRVANPKMAPQEELASA